MVRAARAIGLEGSSLNGFDPHPSKVCKRFETVPVLLMPDGQAAHLLFWHASINAHPPRPSVAQLEAEGWEVETRNPYGALMIMRMNP